MNAKLTKDFSLHEFTRTSYKEFREANSLPPIQAQRQLQILATGVLQPIRNKFNKWTQITSGYRCLGLNRELKSSDTSQHILGEAADFVIKELHSVKDSMMVFEWIYLNSNIQFGDLIHEVRDRGGDYAVWIHISLGYPYTSLEKSGQVWLYRDGEYILVRDNYESPIIEHNL